MILDPDGLRRNLRRQPIGDIVDADKALVYANHAASLAVTANTLRTKAAVMEKRGDVKSATALRDQAKSISTEAETISFGYNNLLAAKKYDEAIAFLNNYAATVPNSPELWRVYAGLGESYAAKGDSAKAKEFFDKAIASAHDNSEKTEVWDSINSVAAEMK